MGSIRRPREGRGWEARYRDPSGRQRSAAFRTKREAERFLARVEADQQRDEWRDRSWRKSASGASPSSG